MKSEDRPLLQCRRDVVIKAEETGALDELVDALTRGAERRLAALGRTPDQPQGWTAFNVSDAIERGERVSGRTAVPRGDDPDPF